MAASNRPSNRPRNLAGLLTDIYRRPGVYFPALGRGSAGKTAAAATYLNYSPQFDTLSALLSQSGETLRTGVQSARRSGYAGSQGIQAVRDRYTAGLKDALGEVGGPVAQDAATHSPDQRAAQMLGLSGTAISGMLSQLAAQQIAGVSNQSAQMRRQHTAELGDIAGRVGSLLGQAGAYNTQQYETLASANRKERAAAAKAAADQRVRLATAGINPDTGRYDPSLNPPPKPAKLTVNKYGRTAEQWAALSDAERRQIIRSYSTADNKGPNKGLTPSERRDRIERYAEIRDTIDSIGDAFKTASSFRIHINPSTGAPVKANSDGDYPDGTTTRPARPNEIAAAIKKQFPHASPLLLRAGNEKAHGFLTTGLIADLKKRYRGLEIPHDWHPPRGYGVLAPKKKNPLEPFTW